MWIFTAEKTLDHVSTQDRNLNMSKGLMLAAAAPENKKNKINDPQQEIKIQIQEN